MLDQKMTQPGEYIVWRGPGFVAHACPAFCLTWEGKEYLVEWHPYCGPARVTRSGDPYSRQPSAHHPFWDGIAAWQRFGLRVDDEGRCITSAQRPTRLMGTAE
jgi:hypothetical protein